MRAGQSPGMKPWPGKWQSGARGARCNTETGRSQAPYLSYIDEEGNTVSVKFDGVDGRDLVDGKTNPYWSKKVAYEAERQIAVADHYGMHVVWELPTDEAAASAIRFLESRGIQGIEMVTVPW